MSNSARDPHTLVLGYPGSVSAFTLSPLALRPRAALSRWLYSGLFRFDDTATLQRDLVEAYEVSADGRRYTFRLRPDVVWHDGTPLSADDVVLTARLLQGPDKYFRNVFQVDGQPLEFQKLDNLTVRADLPRPYAPLLSHLTPTWGSVFLLVPAHRLKDGDEAALLRHPIGTGPFRFGEIDADGNLTLLANERYHGGRPKLERVEIRFINDNDARREAFERGEIDVFVWPGRSYGDEAARRAGGRLYQTPTNNIVQFAMNCRHPLFASPNVRRAIACAVDRERMVREIEGPRGVPAYSPVGPSCWAFEPSVEKHPFDPDRARRLLAEEGWLPDGEGLLRRDGEAFRFSVIFLPDRWRFDYEAYAERIQAYLRAVGIEMEIRIVDYWSGMKPAWRQHQFEAFIFYDTFFVEPDLFWSYHSSMPKRPDGPDEPAGLPQYGYGVTGYSNPTVDRLLEQQRETMDQARRKELLGQAQKIMADEVASLWLYSYQCNSVIHDRVGGLSRPSVAEGPDLIGMLYPERLEKRPID